MTEIIVLDIGNTIWEEGQDGPWVTKTDLTQLMRCAYRVFLAHRDTVPYEYFMKPELRERLLTGGIDFEKELVTREGIEEEASVEVARSKEGLVRIPALLQNHKLGIRGVLDMVSVENERLIPIEIKSHGQLQASDELELAFYWRLLEPIQKGRRDSHREGYVWLSTGELRKVHLYKSHFEQLDAQIAKVRLIKVEGTQPRMVPECNFCVLRDEHFRIIHSLGDVSLIYDIAGQRSKRLEDLGIQNISDLAAVDVTDLHKKWRQIDRYAPSTKQLKEMQAHAYALLEDKVQVVGEDAIPDMKRAIILDLEYETWPRRQIFLVGAIIIEDGKETALHQAFAENISDEKGILAALVNLLKTFPQHKVVTYNGTAADLVEIENAWQRLGLHREAPSNLLDRHADLFSIVRNNFRFPTYGLGLKDIAAYFGFIRAHPETGSFVIPMIYDQFLNPNPPKDTDGRREDSGRGWVRELQGRWPGVLG